MTCVIKLIDPRMQTRAVSLRSEPAIIFHSPATESTPACVEIDVLEANFAAVQSTVHTEASGFKSDGSCNNVSLEWSALMMLVRLVQCMW